MLHVKQTKIKNGLFWSALLDRNRIPRGNCYAKRIQLAMRIFIETVSYQSTGISRQINQLVFNC